MRELLILLCCAEVSAAAPRSIRDVDWKNFSYPLLETHDVPGEVNWMAQGTRDAVLLTNGKYVAREDCDSNEIRFCPLVTFDSVNYGALTGIKSTVAAVALTYHSGGTANWQYVYVLALESGKARLLAWLRTGSRADQGLRSVSITGGGVFSQGATLSELEENIRDDYRMMLEEQD